VSNPIKAEWVSKDGQHRILWGDCLEILPTLDTSEVAAVLADPPYLVHAGAGGGCFGQRNHLVETGGFTDGGVDYQFLRGFPNWLCFCSRRQLKDILTVAENCDRWQLLTWCKPNPVPTCNNKYLPDVEYIVHGFSTGRLFGNYANKSTFHVYPCGNKETDHPNEKPIPVVARLVKIGTEKHDLILDPYAGSCTVAVACARTGRRSLSIEIEEKYYRIGISRMEREAARMPLFEPKTPRQLDLLDTGAEPVPR